MLCAAVEPKAVEEKKKKLETGDRSDVSSGLNSLYPSLSLLSLYSASVRRETKKVIATAAAVESAKREKEKERER